MSPEQIPGVVQFPQNPYTEASSYITFPKLSRIPNFSVNVLGFCHLFSRIDEVIVGGDGASWVKEGAELFGGLYELGRFHLERALHQGLGNGPLVAEIYQACVRGEVTNMEMLLIKAQQEADKDRAKEIMRLRGYVMDNCYGLRDYCLELRGEGLRALGAVGAHVDKLFADRVKKRGCARKVLTGWQS